MLDKNVAVIGLGKMGSILCREMVGMGIVERDRIIGCDPIESKRKKIEDDLGIQVTHHNREAIEGAEIIVLAITPQVLKRVLREMGGLLRKEQLLISIVAGAPLSLLEKEMAEPVPVIRAMPNTAALVKEAITAICRGHYANQEDEDEAKEIFSSIGLVYPLTEDLLDVVTGLSGSGPAYIFMVIEALSDGAVLMGMEREQALLFSAQTVLGAAAMVLKGDMHPAMLRELVTSPGGTTITALSHLESVGVRGSFMKAVELATRRSKELGRGPQNNS